MVTKIKPFFKFYLCVFFFYLPHVDHVFTIQTICCYWFSHFKVDSSWAANSNNNGIFWFLKLYTYTILPPPAPAMPHRCPAAVAVQAPLAVSRTYGWPGAASAPCSGYGMGTGDPGRHSRVRRGQGWDVKGHSAAGYSPTPAAVTSRCEGGDSGG